MTTENGIIKTTKPSKGIIVEGWDRVIQVICAYAYDFAVESPKHEDPSFGQSLWDLLLRVFGLRSARSKRESVNAAGWRLLREERLRFTHWIVGYIIENIEAKPFGMNSYELNVDYTGMDTVFYKSSIRVEEVNGMANKFVVYIESNYGLDGRFEEAIAREHQFELRKS